MSAGECIFGLTAYLVGLIVGMRITHRSKRAAAAKTRGPANSDRIEEIRSGAAAINRGEAPE